MLQSMLFPIKNLSDKSWSVVDERLVRVPPSIAGVLVFIISLLNSFSVHAANQTLTMRGVVAECRELVHRGTPEQMEALFTTARGDGGTLPETMDGIPLLCFVRMMMNEHKSTVPNMNDNMSRFLGRWAKAYSDSINLHICQLHFQAGLLIRAKTAPKDWKKKWEEVMYLLTRLEERTLRSADWYECYVMTAVAARMLQNSGQLSDLPETVRDWRPIVEEGIRKYPRFVGILVVVGDWHRTLGIKDSRMNWARDACALIPQTAYEPYARMAWMFEPRHVGLMFKMPGGSDWELVKKGFMAIIKRVPGSRWNKANFLRFSRIAGDIEAGRMAMEMLGGRPDDEIYGLSAKWWEVQNWLNGVKPHQPVWKRQFENVGGLVWSKDGTKLFAAVSGAGIKVMQAGDGADAGFLNIKNGSHTVSAVAISSDGNYVAGCQGGELQKGPSMMKVWRTSDFEEVAAFSSSIGPFRSLAFSRNSNALFAGGGLFGKRSELWHWSPESGPALIDWGDDHKHGIEAIAWRPDSNAVVFNCTNGHVTLAENGEETRFFKQISVPGRGFIHQLEYSPDGRWLGAAVRVGEWSNRHTSRGSLAFFHSDTMKPRDDTLAPIVGGLLTLNYSPDGTMVATAGYDGHVYVLDVETLEALTWWDASGEEVWAVRWSPDGQYIAVGSMDGWVSVWNVAK